MVMIIINNNIDINVLSHVSGRDLNSGIPDNFMSKLTCQRESIFIHFLK